ncbi:MULTISPECIES: ABC transporter ATP-binding protein [Halobacterium]|uniref:Peptide/nickel transport system ATP-binding protein n=4 Tax=Halobacterium salinarum TaxID=2242 RepID=A0A841H9K5_HALSI|nr:MULTISPECIES: ABC transporter ATP-binding protein [Halobacterium]AAG20448.1 oligopeptide ABC transporter ATP-binding [Halobacterium salinarum NRC-1]MBB6089621.1 peptide/nickel transport system ATP-binding protein [Halobacterium salinarum]MCF2164369.1 ABC transporter ATP-binding protein [Halobacterium salinarum]MCF2167156.1 ABC transporter ATP-binding protein [Halobacterium salinarum]MCF2207177.1 ABC transporter ATP-binding protein [Halobacterium salinarum]
MSQQSIQSTADADQHSQPLVEVTDLKKHYGDGGRFSGPPVKAVDGVNFEIQEGETLGLVGESGSGKTTLGRTLIQLETATEGTVSFDGRDITKLTGSDLKQWRKNAQIVFQDPDSSLNDRMTIGEIVREPLDAHDWNSPAERRDRVKELLSSVGLQADHYYRYPHQFSGGQRQRIGIARALALEPEFMVLDEPVSALDASVQAKILNLLEDLQDEFGLTYLFIAHDLSVVRHICDRVAVMYLGKIMEIGETEELYADAKNPYTRSLLSAIPRPDPTIDRNRITLPGAPPSPRNPPAGCQFSTRCPAKIRPEAYADIDDDTWSRIEQFREVVRERTRDQMGVRDRVKRRLGTFSKYDDIEEAADDLFADVDLPAGITDTVDTAIEAVKDGRPTEAHDALTREFGGVCDTERPDMHQVSDAGRLSYCHRHDSEYDSVADTLADRSHE